MLVPLLLLEIVLLPILLSGQVAGPSPAVSTATLRRYSGEAEHAARAFLRENAGALSRARAGLRLQRTLNMGGHRIVRFSHTVDGVPVDRRETIVALDAEGQVFFASTSEPVPGSIPSQWILSAAQAVQAVRELRSLDEIEGSPRARAIWYPLSATGLIPAYEVRFATWRPPGAWRYVIHAQDGSVLAQQDLLHRADAMVFVQNPVIDRGRTERVSLPNLESDRVLTGRFARVWSSIPAVRGLQPLNTVVQVAQADRNGNFLYSVDDVRFDETQLYWGIDQAHARFKALGFDLLDRPLDAVTYFPAAAKHGPFYSPEHFDGRGGIFFSPFGPRPSDFTWDTDLIYHEYSHAVMRAAAGDSDSPEFGALNEGFADYFSSSFQDNPAIGEWGVRAVSPSLPYLRTAENSARFPRDYVTEAHSGSLIWSGALWDIRKQMGAPRADRIALLTMTLLDPSSGYIKAALAAAAAAKILFGDEARDQVTAAMVRRGILSTEGISVFAARDLENGFAVEGRIEAAPGSLCILDDARQYRIHVPANGIELAVALASIPDANLRLFVRYRQPVTVENGRAIADYHSDLARRVGGRITFDSTPELQAGFYYLAVSNCSPDPVSFGVGAGYAAAGSPSPVPTAILQPGEEARGSIPAGPLMNSRQFIIRVPANATSLQVTVRANTNVDLYASFEQPVRPTDVGLPLSEVFSATARHTETIVLSRSTKPALQPGVYVFAVYNRDENQTAQFTLSAAVGTDPLPGTSFISLVPGGSVQVIVPAAPDGSGIIAHQQLEIAVPSGARSLTISSQTSEDVSLFVRAGSPVETRNGEPLADFLLNTVPGLLEISNMTFPALQPGTNYYIAIASFSQATASVTTRTTIR